MKASVDVMLVLEWFAQQPFLSAVGGLLAMLFAGGLGVWAALRGGASALGEADPRQSLLAPTLAVDALDPDLRVLYMKTLVLDALLDECREKGMLPHTDPARLGRELRRLFVSIQADRCELDAAADRRLEEARELMVRAFGCVEDEPARAREAHDAQDLHHRLDELFEAAARLRD